MSNRHSIILARKANLRQDHVAYKDAKAWASRQTSQTGQCHAVFYDDTLDCMVVAKYGAKDKLPRLGWCPEITGFKWADDDAPVWGSA